LNIFVEANGDTLRFVEQSGKVSHGTFDVREALRRCYDTGLCGGARQSPIVRRGDHWLATTVADA
jgi:hypothetical protein